MAHNSICEELLSRDLNGGAEMEGSLGAETYEKAPYPWNPLLQQPQVGWSHAVPGNFLSCQVGSPMILLIWM